MIAAENQYFSLPAALRSPAIGQSSMNPGQVFRYLQAPLAIRPPITQPRKRADRRKIQGSSVSVGIAKAILAVLSRWGIPDEVASVILGSDRDRCIAELESGYAALDTRDMRDRAKLFLDIYEGVHGLMKDPQAERNWVKAPRIEFGGQSVFSLVTEGSQRNLIRALGFVDYVNGR